MRKIKLELSVDDKVFFTHEFEATDVFDLTMTPLPPTPEGQVFWRRIAIPEVAPVRFYSNVNRDPVIGDVVTTKHSSLAGPWFYTGKGWISRLGLSISGGMPATGNILLVDGNTGMAPR